MKLQFWLNLIFVAGIIARDAADWETRAANELKDALKVTPNINIAKNVIFFVGDGMGVSTVTAARIYKGQKYNRVGELESFSFENFPNVGMSKTFSNDAQVTESAAAANAMLCGRKTNAWTIGVSNEVVQGDCDSAQGKGIDSILDWSAEAGKWTGIVTNTRITHATPAAAYAHSAERAWEADAKQPDDKDLRSKCKDIAHQLITENSFIRVLMGGARTYFLPNTTTDPEYNDTMGLRQDGKDLIQQWMDDREAEGVSHAYVWNETAFNDVDPETTDYLLGLFQPSHMQYEMDRPSDKGGEPSLTSMTEKAINILKRNQDKGYFLLVEGGRIDHAHHDNLAKKALDDTEALDEAVKKALELTKEDDTLIIVTADHAIPFVMGSWASLDNPILGFVDTDGVNDEPPYDALPMVSLTYANGPGPEGRKDLTGVDTTGDEYMFPSGVNMKYSTHGGEDVIIYARGPMGHLIHGIHENQYLAHVMGYASCVGKNKDHCNGERTIPGCDVTAGAERLLSSITLLLVILLQFV